MSVLSRYGKVESGSSRIPREAPRAPTEEEWAALTPEQREQVIEALACSVSQEELDEREAMSESDDHYDAKDEAHKVLKKFFAGRGQVYVGAERKVLYPGRKGFTPDIIVVCGVSPHKRDCWMVSQEGRGVDVIIEIFWKGDWRKDFVDNVREYASLKVPEYFIYDAFRRMLTAYRLSEDGTVYVPIKRRAARYHSEKLGLDLAVRRGKLRFFHGGEQLPTPDELISELEEIAEQEQARAEQEQALAEQEQARAEQEQARAEQEQARARRACDRLAEGVLTVARVRGLRIGEADAARVRETDDVELLSRWMTRVSEMTQEEYEKGALFLDS
jgi:Uma2 family endonuclease